MTETAPDVLGWLRTRAIADAAGDGAMFQEAATLLYDFKINTKALLVFCDSTGSGDAIYSLQCLRRLVERMESPNREIEGKRNLMMTLNEAFAACEGTARSGERL